MSLALLAFPGSNQISPWWYELKKSELLWNVFCKGAHFGLEMPSGRPHPFVSSQVLLTLKNTSSLLVKSTVGANSMIVVVGVGVRREEGEKFTFSFPETK